MYVILLVSFLAGAAADYKCVCNYHVELRVYPRPYNSSNITGYIYEFDCKPSYQSPHVSPIPNWEIIQFEKKVGYVKTDGQVVKQTCPGDPSPSDLVPGSPVKNPTTLSASKAPKPTSIQAVTSITAASNSTVSLSYPTTVNYTSAAIKTSPINISMNTSTAGRFANATFNKNITTPSGKTVTTSYITKSVLTNATTVVTVATNTTTSTRSTYSAYSSSKTSTHSTYYNSSKTITNKPYNITHITPNTVKINTSTKGLSTPTNSTTGSTTENTKPPLPTTELTTTSTKSSATIANITKLTAPTTNTTYITPYTFKNNRSTKGLVTVVNTTTGSIIKNTKSALQTITTTSTKSSATTTNMTQFTPLTTSITYITPYTITNTTSTKGLVNVINSTTGSVIKNTKLPLQTTGVKNNSTTLSTTITNTTKLTPSTTNMTSFITVTLTTNKPMTMGSNTANSQVTSSTLRPTPTISSTSTTPTVTAATPTTKTSFSTATLTTNRTTTRATNTVNTNVTGSSFRPTSTMSSTSTTATVTETPITQANKTLKFSTTTAAPGHGKSYFCPFMVKHSTMMQYLAQHGNYCYELYPYEAKDWLSAESYCRYHHGTLAVISSQEIQQVVEYLLQTTKFYHSVWIGLHDLQTEGKWEWIDGTPLAYANWNTGHRDPVYHEEQDCALLDGRSGRWKEVVCKGFMLDIQRHPWVCQYRTWK